MTKVSFIVTVYNKAPYLENVFEGIFNQIGKFEREIVVINDGSTDDSLEILQEIKSQNSDKNIKICSQENGGVVSATINGIKKSTGDYIKFVDADDFIHPNLTERLIDAVVNFNVTYSYAPFGGKFNSNFPKSTKENIIIFDGNVVATIFGDKNKRIIPSCGGTCSLVKAKEMKSILKDIEHYCEKGIRSIQDHIIGFELLNKYNGCALLKTIGVKPAKTKNNQEVFIDVKKRLTKYNTDVAKFYLEFFKKNGFSEKIEKEAYKSIIITLTNTLYKDKKFGKFNSFVYFFNPYYRIKKKAKRARTLVKMKKILKEFLKRLDPK